MIFGLFDGPEIENYIKSDLVKKIESGGLKASQPSTWTIDDNMHLLDFSSDPQQRWEPLQKKTFEDKKNFDEIMLQFMQFPITKFDHMKGECGPSALEYEEPVYVLSSLI